jgi:hypothetical protein
MPAVLLINITTLISKARNLRESGASRYADSLAGKPAEAELFLKMHGTPGARSACCAPDIIRDCPSTFPAVWPLVF